MRLKSRQELKTWLHDDSLGGKRRVILTNGCFDLIHPGTVRFFDELNRRALKMFGPLQCGEWGQRRAGCGEHIILVAVNSDRSVRSLKPGRPINKLADRMEVLNGLKGIDAVCSFEEATPLNIVKLVKPAVLAKGGDWAEDKIIGADFVKSHGGSVWVIPYSRGYSTTRIIERIRRGEAQR